MLTIRIGGSVKVWRTIAPSFCIGMLMSWSDFNFKRFYRRRSSVDQGKAAGQPVSQIQLESLEDRVLFDASPLGDLLRGTDASVADVGSDNLLDFNFNLTNQDAYLAGLETLNFDELALDAGFPDATLESLEQLVDSLFAVDNGNQSSQREHDSGSGPSEPSSSQSTQLIIVDGSIEGLQELLADIDRFSQTEAQVLVLNSQKDGLEQIGLWVSQFSQVSEIHLFAHANENELQLGSTSVSLSSIANFSELWMNWNQSLADGADLLIYGCDLASTESGRILIEEMARWTGLNIAASTDLTGTSAWGSDWNLEFSHGEVSSASIFEGRSDEELVWRGMLNLPSQVVSVNGNDKETSSLSGGSDRAIAMHTDGSFVLVWSEDVGGSSNRDVFGRRFAADGTALTSSFIVNQYTDNEQRYAAIGMDEAGNFVVTWTSKNQDGSGDGVWGRRFSANGTPLSNEFQVNTHTTGEQRNSSVAVRGDGSFVIVWEGAGSSDSYGIYGQRFNASGAAIPGNFWVNPLATNSQYDASVSINASGNFAVSWDDTDGYHFQRFDWSSSKIGSKIEVSGLSSAGNGSILLNDDNTLVTTWRSAPLGLTQVWTRVYDSANVSATGPILVNSFTVAHNHNEPSISGTGSGSYIITWEGESGSDNGNIFARHFNSDGSYASSAFVVNDQTSGTQTMASVATLSSTSFVVAWTDDGDGAQGQGVYARVFGSPPVLDTGNNPVLNPVNEGFLSSPGTLVSNLLPPGSVIQVSGPPDHGLAIVDLNSSFGTWQFSLDGGSVWTNIDANSINSQTNELALLLGPTARIRLIPFADLNGTPANALTFRAWDLSIGTAGTYSVISNPGVGASPFSLATDTAAIPITAVNDTPGFETGVGFATNAHGSSAVANSIAQQVDEKTVITGRFLNGSQWDIFVTRYNFDGSLDTTFGTNGSVEFGLGSADDWSNTVAIQSDGKIVIGGQTTVSGFTQQAVARFNSDGTLDATFGTAGVFVNAIGVSNHDVKDLKILNDGKILFVGGTVDGYRKFTAVQLNSNGTLDTSFGTNGVVMTDLGSAAFGRALEIQADGKILLGGYRVVSGVSRIAVVRYHADGTQDSTFGTGGISELNIVSSELNSMQVLNDGRILIGATLGTGTSNDFAVVRLQSNGSLDTSFQSVGYRALDFGFDDELTDVVVQQDGKIVLVGSSNPFPINVVAAIRLNADGSDDLTYGTNGKIQHEVGSFSRGNAALRQFDGKLMISGSANPNGPLESLLLRLDENGSLNDLFARGWNLGGTLSIEENGTPVVLDSNIEILDIELLAAGNYGGSQLELHRNGGAVPGDVFSATGTLGTLTEGSVLTVGGTAIGTVTNNSGGRLLLTFDANATQPMVNQVAQQIAFRNTTAPDGQILDVLFHFNDGNLGAQGYGGAEATWGSVQLTVVSSNTAPVLDSLASPTFSSINEDEINNNGHSVADLLASAGNPITDSNVAALEGIAITGLNEGNGRWQFSINSGATWNVIGIVSDANALLLRDNDRIRLVPNGENGTTADITFRAWDQTGITAGQQGLKLDASINGGTRAFSTATAVASIIVSSVNDAPVFDNSGTMTLTTMSEDQTNNSGDTISAIISSAGGNRITDVDSGAVEGVAITGLNSGNGSWEYSIDNGTSWASVNGVSDAAALLLRADDRIRFVPNGENGTTASFTFRAWDQAGATAGQQGTKTNVSINGGSTHFSTNFETASITVTSTNDAPALDTLGSFTFDSINENQTNDSGDLVSSMIASAGGNRITDVDASAIEGIAITGLNAVNGRWQYSINGGSNWTNVGTVSDASALLLRHSDRIRFVPNTQNGTTADISFRAWDQTGVTTGQHGTKVNITASGTTTPFSTQTATASIVVTDRNDAPVLDNSGTMTLVSIDEDQTSNSGDSISAIISSAGGNRITDVDSGAVEGVAITGLNSGNGRWEYSIDNGSSWTNVDVVGATNALLLRAEDRIRFVPDGDNGTSASFTFRAWDQTGVTAGQQGTKTNVSTNGGSTPFSSNLETASIVVNSVNDAPNLNSSRIFSFTSIDEDQFNNSGDLVSSLIASTGMEELTDVDTGAIEGIAITNLDSGFGTWQYSVNAGVNWIDVGTVSDFGALLLRSSDRIRFVPDGENGTTSGIEFRAWDQTGITAGQYGTKVNASVNGNATPFSTQTATANIVVTDINNAPVLDNTGATTLPAIGENDSNNIGDTVASIVGSRISDVDSGALEGIAIGAINSGNGSWEFSIDNGSTWSEVGAVSPTNALLLRSDDRIRFVPDGENGTIASFAFRAWDQGGATFGQQGTKTSITTHGGTTHFSTDFETASIAVVSVNDAPILDNSSVFTFSAIDEDQSTNAGDDVSSLLASVGSTAISDVDIGRIEGIAVTGLRAGIGRWQFSTNAGATWNSIGLVSDANALLLRSSDRIRFVPDGENGTTSEIEFRAWDQTGTTAGQHGTKVNALVNGVASSFSAQTATAKIDVTDVNDAPVLDDSGSMALTTISENQTNNPGDLVSSIISSAGGDRITDVDANSVEGMAITGLNSGSGTWEFSVNNGLNWIGVGTVSESNALLLRVEDRIRFVPDGGNGTSADFTFRAWDQTGLPNGLQGTKVNLLASGGQTPVSAMSEVATITVTDQNDAPVFSIQVGDADFAQITESDTSLNSSGTLTVNDGDIGDSVSASVTAVQVSGATQGLGSNQSALLAMLTTNTNVLNPPNTTGTIYWQFDSSGETFDYLAVGQIVEMTYTIEVTDSLGGRATYDIAIQIIGSNDAPRIVTSPGNIDQAALLETNSALSAAGSIAVSDSELTQVVTGSVKSVNVLGDSAGWNASAQQIKNMLQINGAVVNSGTTIGTLAWNFNSVNDSFNFLAEGANLQLVYTVEVTDSFASFNQQITIQITGTNDAPILKSGAGGVLASGEAGDRIGSLAGLAGSLSDFDFGSNWGLAITTGDNASGVWQYRLDASSQWHSIDTTSLDRATLLSSNDYIRYVSGSENAATGSLTFKGWDMTYGGSGSSVLLSDLAAESAISGGSGELLVNVAGPPKDNGNNGDSESESDDPKPDTGSEGTENDSEPPPEDLAIGGNQTTAAKDQNTSISVGQPAPFFPQTTEDLKVAELKLNLSLIEEAYDPSNSDNYYRLNVNPNEAVLEFGEAYVFGNANPISFDDELIWTRFFEGLNQSSRELLITQYQIGVPTFAASTASLLTVGYLAWMIRGGVLLTTFMSSLPTWKALDILPLIEGSAQDRETIEQIVDSKVTA